ncbi:MAG TPA: glycosyltransferase [Vicinamibacterales bacterium]|nr:glycosyltransferase [Vicinamibacterales bacterium]
MNVGIYSEPHGGAPGGAEFCVAALAEALRRFHNVEIVQHRSDLTIADLSRMFGTDLDGCTIRHVPFEWPTYYGPMRPWRRAREARQWRSELSEPYDLFVNFTHGLPPFCHAPIGVLVVLFPWFDRREEGPCRLQGDTSQDRLRRLFSAWEWRRRFATYQVRLATSKFSREYARKWWDLDCQVVYPPAGGGFEQTDKADAILSVGRFATLGHSKKQVEMMTTFRRLERDRLSGWEYVSAGGLGDSPDDVKYFAKVRSAAAGGRACVLANLERAQLTRLFERSKIFWHAAGYGEDDSLLPQLTEHFGIVTVEAMSAGCVPVVINKGGQSEIVDHGVSGFLWNTTDELMHYTTQLAQDEALCERMAEAARVRAKAFGKERYAAEFLQIVDRLMSRQ